LRIILPCALIVAAAFPCAAEGIAPYIGGQYMQSRSSCQGFEDGVAPLGLTATCDDTDHGYRVYGGVNLTKVLGVEVGYLDAGEGRADAFANGVYALTLTSPFHAWDALLTGRVKLGGSATAIARAGIAHWNYEVVASAGSFGAKNDGNTFTFGAGLEFKILTIGYDAILDVGQGNLLDPTAPDIKQTIHRLSAGLKFTFR
jgi:hypothetical protein